MSKNLSERINEMSDEEYYNLKYQMHLNWGETEATAANFARISVKSRGQKETPDTMMTDAEGRYL